MTLLERTLETLLIKEKKMKENKAALDPYDEAFAELKAKGNDEYEERVDNKLSYEKQKNTD